MTLPQRAVHRQARRVMVREWEPSMASDAEVAAVVDLLNAAVEVDTPGDPPWIVDGFREYVATTMPGERRAAWVVGEEGGPLLGYAMMLLMDDMGVFELSVHPEARRHGVGSALLLAAARRASDEGIPSLGIEVVGDTPAVPFYEGHGFRWAYAEMRNVLDLSTVDWQRLDEMARGIGSGYRVEAYPGGPPEELYAAYAAAKESVRGDDPADLELRPSSYDPERLRDSLATLHARGLKPYIVLAIHESTDTVAGLTEVVVPRQRPSRADQYDTVVVPEHRGYGLGRALKARMLFELKAAEPTLREVQTWHDAENEPLLKVNAELGFQPDREWREYEVEVVDLLHRLRPAVL
ncbi:GNAT family N-acetyltransferase [Virgisporangium aliadipatigenens]|nr:GNAT family N-acetyltransferase [Virgisporangium aliadipatigenens]